MLPDDILILRGPPDGIAEVRALAARPNGGHRAPVTIPHHRPRPSRRRPRRDEEHLRGRGRAAYSALLFYDQSLAAEVSHLEDRLDEMRERLEVWVLRAAAEHIDPSPLRGLLHLGSAAEELGDAARQMVWLVEQGEEMHPVLGLALGDSDEVMRVPVAAGSQLEGRSLREANLELETGSYLLAIRRRPLHLPASQPRSSRSRRRAHRHRPRRRPRSPGRARRLPRRRGRRHRRDRARPHTRRHLAAASPSDAQ